MSVRSSSPRGRRERLGADFARVWARELVLGNPYGKSVLLAVANYMNEDGSAWPGTATIARDTDISEDTVVKRLRWLEAIGAIALFKCWVDENGRRNHDGRGKPTSSEIRFLFDADVDAIESAARETVEPRVLRGAALAAQSDKSSPRPARELDSDQPPTSPPVAPDQPPPGTGCHIEGNLEPEEDSPNPPSGGGREAIDQEFEEDIAAFVEAWNAPVTDLPRLRDILVVMVRPLRRKIITAAKSYDKYIIGLAQRGKPRARKDAHRWVSGGQWQGYVSSGEEIEKTQLVQQIPVDSQAGRALEILHQIAHISPPRDFSRNYTLSRPLTAQALALARAPPVENWVFIPDENRNQCQAWTELIAAALAGKPRPVLVSVWPRNPKGQKGFMAPWPWPPKKDGTIYVTNDDDEFVNQKQGLG